MHEQPADTVVLHPGCKINLFLRILSTRKDGYHNLATLFYPLPEPADRLRITPIETPGTLDFHCSNVELNTSDNSVVQAYQSFIKATGYAPGLSVTLDKHIPSGAGLGGGSSDAASLLLYLNEHAGNKRMSNSELTALAVKLGADVPFFLLNTPALAGGVGDVLEPVNIELHGLHCILIFPEIHVNTGRAYAAFDALKTKKIHIECEEVLTEARRLFKKYFCSGGLHVVNDFERPIFRMYPELGEIKQNLLIGGADAVCMSGSGSTIFGLFRNRAKVDEFAKGLEHSVGIYIFTFPGTGV